MNDLDDLRQALQSPPDYVPRALDLGEIMTRGARLRRLRRLAAGAAAALSVVVLLVGGSLLVDRDHLRPGTPGAPAAALPGTGGPIGATSPTPDPDPSATARPLGEVIRTGLAAGDAEWALYAVPVQESALPKVHFGVMLGVRAKDGSLTSKVVINETERADRAPGFHPGEAALTVDGLRTPAFGYVVGPANRVTATVGRHDIGAYVRAWSEDPSVVIFWFDPARIGPDTRVTKLTAYNRAGRQLAVSSSGFGVG